MNLDQLRLWIARRIRARQRRQQIRRYRREQQAAEAASVALIPEWLWYQ